MSAPNSPTDDSFRIRRSIACIRCRQRHVRCVPLSSSASGRCERCEKFNYDCEFKPVVTDGDEDVGPFPVEYTTTYAISSIPGPTSGYSPFPSSSQSHSLPNQSAYPPPAPHYPTYPIQNSHPAYSTRPPTHGSQSSNYHPQRSASLPTHLPYIPPQPPSQVPQIPPTQHQTTHGSPPLYRATHLNQPQYQSSPIPQTGYRTTPPTFQTLQPYSDLPQSSHPSLPPTQRMHSSPSHVNPDSRSQENALMSFPIGQPRHTSQVGVHPHYAQMESQPRSEAHEIARGYRHRS